MLADDFDALKLLDALELPVEDENEEKDLLFDFLANSAEEARALVGKDEKELAGLVRRTRSRLLREKRGDGRGVRALLLLAAQAPDQIFIKHAKFWLAQASEAAKLSDEGAAALQVLLKRSKSLPEVSRSAAETAAAVLPPTNSSLTKAFMAAANNFPGSCIVGGTAEKALCLAVKPGASAASIKVVARCLAALPGLGGGGKDGAKHIERWSTMADKMAGTIENLIGSICDGSDVSTTSGLPLPSCHLDDPLARRLFAADLVEKVSFFFSELLQSDFPVAKRINLTRIVNLADLAAQMTTSRTCLPKVWTSVAKLLVSLLLVAREDCLVFVPAMHHFGKVVLKYCMGESFYSASREAFAETRAAVFDLFTEMARVLGSSSGFHLADDLTNCILSEIQPFFKPLTLQATKGKKKKGNETITVSKEQVCYSPAGVMSAALVCLSEIVSVSGALMRPQILKLIHAVVVHAGQNLVQSHVGRRLQHHRVVQFRLSLCKALLSVGENAHPSFPPPLRIVLAHLEAHARVESDPEVKSFCSVALSSLRSHIRPRALALDSFITSTEEIDKSKEDLMKVHVYTLQEDRRDVSELAGKKRRLKSDPDRVTTLPKLTKKTLEDCAANNEEADLPQLPGKETPPTHNNGLQTMQDATREVTVSERKVERQVTEPDVIKRKGPVNDHSDDVHVQAALEEYFKFSDDTPVVVPDAVKNRQRQDDPQAAREEEPKANHNNHDEVEEGNDSFDLDKIASLFLRSSDEVSNDE